METGLFTATVPHVPSRAHGAELRCSERFPLSPVSKDGKVVMGLRGWTLSQANHTQGYKVVSVFDKQKGRHALTGVHVIVAHAWLPLPAHLGSTRVVVMHRDDNTANNHADNLQFGTHSDNTQDTIKKGRLRKDYSRKLLTADILAIRQSEEPGTVLAKRYGVSEFCISCVRRGKTNADVGGPFKPARKRLTDAQVAEVKASPLTVQELVQAYGISDRAIIEIKRGISRRGKPR